MSDSSTSDEDNNEIWVYYKNRKDWQDLHPIPQNDGPTPVVSIAYSQKFTDIYDFFRAVVNAGEKSERALALTADAIIMNPANYTVWQYRREILKALNKDLHEELKYIGDKIKEYSKNYQVWRHRQIIVEWLGKPDEELELTALILAQDAKNYHAWQHRQWVISTFNLFSDELEYIESLISHDVRNNSAWTQRYFVINHTTQFTPEVVTREIEYCREKILIAPKNESPWNYLRGVLLHADQGLQDPRVVSWCEELYSSQCTSRHLLGYLIDVAVEGIQSGDQSGLERAQQMCKDLATTYDRIRRTYWEYVGRTIAQSINQDANPSGESGSRNKNEAVSTNEQGDVLAVSPKETVFNHNEESKPEANCTEKLT
uniref:Protein farnesyltransferase/geranylgeranyltransferase type-1 subunit alpha n=1 Tax=Cacopsylla melanoneura TaxID=428564 RepID=A0A8D8LM50_9HEMI